MLETGLEIRKLMRVLVSLELQGYIKRSFKELLYQKVEEKYFCRMEEVDLWHIIL